MKHEVMERRTKISRLMAKSVVKAEDISKTLNIKVKTVYDDIAYLKKQSSKWLYGFANDGYIFVTKQTIYSLYDIEVELKKMRQEAIGQDNKLKVIRELRETINTRWVIQGTGPTLMVLQKTNGSKST